MDFATWHLLAPKDAFPCPACCAVPQMSVDFRLEQNRASSNQLRICNNCGHIFLIKDNKTIPMKLGEIAKYLDEHSRKELIRSIQEKITARMIG
jgi:RNase P subunit RPR2